jgi:hypothetical protein
MLAMPTISVFFGVVIRMYHNDHAPPHFHATYGANDAMIDIRTLTVLEGRLPRRAMALVLEWAAEHRLELHLNWGLCERLVPLNKVAPLE